MSATFCDNVVLVNIIRGQLIMKQKVFDNLSSIHHRNDHKKEAGYMLDIATALEDREYSELEAHKDSPSSNRRKSNQNTEEEHESAFGDQEREIANIMVELRSRAECKNLMRLAEATTSAQMGTSSSSGPQENQSADFGQSQPSQIVNAESASVLVQNSNEPMPMMQLLRFVKSRISTTTPSMAAPGELTMKTGCDLKKNF